MHNKVPKNEYLKGKPGKKQNAFKKDKVVYDQKSMMGYRDDSPYRQLPFIDINTPNGYIDMSYTGMPLFANGQYLPPYSGQHFMGTNIVREVPIQDEGFDLVSLPGHVDFIDKGFIPSKTTARYYPQNPEYFQKGGEERPKVYSDYNTYLKAKQLYQDSLNLHLRGLETLNFGRKFPGATNATLNQIEDIMDEKYPVSPDLDTFGKNVILPIDMPKIGKGSAERSVPQYKKPVTIPEYKPTPVSVEQPKPTPAPAPVPTEPSTKYAYMPTNWGPTYYYEWDAQQKRWIPISQQSYNYNTEGGTKNTQLYSSTPPGFQYGGDPSIPELTQAKKGGWLNKYSKMPKKTSSKNIKTSINKLMVKNPLFERNYMLYGAKGPRLYDPSSKYQGGGQPKPIVVFDPNDPRLRAYEDSLNLYNSNPKVVQYPLTSVDYFIFSHYPQDFKIKPIGTANRVVSPTVTEEAYVFKKPVQPVVVGTTPKSKPVKQPEPIQTPAPVEQPKASTPAEQPKTQPLYKKTQAPNLPPFYWKYDSTAKQWYQISEREYNNAPAEQKKTGGNTGWLDSYQGGGITINSEEEYKKSLLMKNKTKERMDAERAWVAKKAAAQKAQSTPKPTYGPTPDQQAALFGMKSLPSETSQRAVMPAKTAEIKAQEQKVFDTQVKQKMKDNPNWDRQKAVSAVNVERAYQGPGVIKEAQPEQGIISKTIEVAANPFNALDAYVQSGYVPDYFSQSKDAVNPLNTVYQMATPAGWYTTGAQALYNKLPKDVEQGNWLGVGEDILMGIPLAGKIGSKALNFTANRVANTPKVNFRTGNIEVYNPETGMYDMYNVSLPNQIVPGRPYQDVAPKMKSLRKDLGISYPEHLANKYIPGFAREIPLEQGKGIVIDPVSGRLFDSNTRYWLNREYGITPKIDPLLSERASSIAKNYGTKISESATPINKSGITYGAPNPALGNPVGTIDDIKNINSNIKELRNPETGEIIYRLEREDYPFGNDWETMAPKDFTDYSNPWINKYYSTSGGYSDIPQFNQQIQGFNTQMQFGKRPLETQINVRPQTQNLLANQALLESQGNVPQYYYNTPVYPGFSTLERRPLTGYQMFQQIQPNKYGGTPRKSGKKLVNYTQKPNFVKTQSTSWLDKYK